VIRKITIKRIEGTTPPAYGITAGTDECVWWSSTITGQETVWWSLLIQYQQKRRASNKAGSGPMFCVLSSFEECQTFLIRLGNSAESAASV
jgi:hypothetical protein